MPMVTIIAEGEPHARGLNFIRVSDGGYAVAIRSRRRLFYARLRGSQNKARPRAYGYIGRHASPL